MSLHSKVKYNLTIRNEIDSKIVTLCHTMVFLCALSSVTDYMSVLENTEQL